MKDHAIPVSDINELYEQIEGKLETMVETLLLSKMNDTENVFQVVRHMLERVFIKSAMKLAQNNVSQASKLLGINRNTLSKKLKEIERIL